MNTKLYKFIELFLLFVVMPILFSVERLTVWFKVVLGGSGFLYILWNLIKEEQLEFKISKTIKWKKFWKFTLLKLSIIAVITTSFVAITAPESLFVVLINKPLLWFVILLIYSSLSVYPQELIFRNFFFKRYKPLVKNSTLFIYLNAILFALAHLFFQNTLVILLTFVGGLFFAHTYNKTDSTLLVTLEHAIYGSWLFTVGMGTILGFPG